MDNNNINKEETRITDWDEFIDIASTHAVTICKVSDTGDYVYGFNTTEDSDLVYLNSESDRDHFIEGTIGKGYIKAVLEYDGDRLSFEATI